MNAVCFDLASYIRQYLVKFVIPFAEHNKVMRFVF